MGPTNSFVRLMKGLNEQDQQAITEIYERFIGQMAQWASRRINSNMQSKIDADSVAASAMASFLLNYEKGDYDFQHWGGVMKLLATITIRKCLNRIRELQTQRRNLKKEQTPNNWEEAVDVLEPEATVITQDMIEHVLKPFERKKQLMVLAKLEGQSADSIAAENEVSKRYVERVFADFRERFREYLNRLAGYSPNSDKE